MTTDRQPNTEHYTVDGLLQAIAEARNTRIEDVHSALDAIEARARELSVNVPSNSAPIASFNGVTDATLRLRDWLERRKNDRAGWCKEDRTGDWRRGYNTANDQWCDELRTEIAALESFAQSRNAPLAVAAVNQQLADALRLLWREHEFYHYEHCPSDASGNETDCKCFHGGVNSQVVAALAAYDAQKVADGTDRKGGEKS